MFRETRLVFDHLDGDCNLGDFADAALAFDLPTSELFIPAYLKPVRPAAEVLSSAVAEAGGPLVLQGPYGTRIRSEHGDHFIKPDENDRGINFDPASPNAVFGLPYGPTPFLDQYFAEQFDGVRGFSRFAHLQTLIDYINSGIDLVTTNTFSLGGQLDRKRFAATVVEHYLLAREAQRIAGRTMPIVVPIGPIGDCYIHQDAPSFDTSKTFYDEQFARLKGLNLDVSVFMAETICNQDEARAIAWAAKKYQLPVVISFVIDAQGNLFDGTSVVDAIKQIETSDAGGWCSYGFNCCSYPGTEAALLEAEKNNLLDKIVGVHLNATDADVRDLDGHSESTGCVVVAPDLAARSKAIASLANRFNLSYFSGCCGFDPESIGHLVASKAGRVVTGYRSIPEGLKNAADARLGCHSH